jgi:hypothetical protein
MNDLTPIMQRHSVAISHDSGNGSGVLIQGMDDDFSYIFTAKHVIQVDKDNPDKGLRTKEELTIKDINDRKLVLLNTYIDKALDIAIIKIEFYPSLEITPYHETLSRETEVFLYGCPKGIPPQTYTLRYIGSDEGRVEFSITEPVQVHEMEGFSGGGVFYIENENVYIYGVDNSAFMQAEVVNRPKGFHISKFITLIEHYNLARLKPLLLSCFKHVELLVFNDVITEEDNSILEAITTLKDKIDENNINTAVTPLQILSNFEKQLLTYRQERIELEDENLWKAFLEFISVQLLINGPEDCEEGWELSFLEYIFSSYRFMYTAKADSYKRLYRELIAPSDISKLLPNGKIILFASGHMPPEPDSLTKMKRLPPNIANGLDKIGIANVKANVKSNNKIIHWPKLNDKCLADREDYYVNLNRIHNENQIITMLKQDYEEYLKVEENK